MIKEIEYSDIDNDRLKLDYILVDLRSPGEYKKFTIPGAINMPIFDNSDRELIGYTYKNKSREEATRIGVNIVARKLPELYDKVVALEKKHKSVIFFCERGGMRSSSLVGLLSSLGMKVYKLKDGYKGYRNYINENLPKLASEIDFVVIHGHTGVGKTKILYAIESQGGGMLDLEGCANHRGSFFGSVGLGDTESQKQFETNIYESLKHRNGDTLFVEAESRRIGRVMIPDCIFEKMDVGIHVNVRADMEKRVENILDDYDCDSEQIIDALDKLKAYKSKSTIESYIEEIKNDNYAIVAEKLMVDYYDPMYSKKERSYMAEFKNENEQVAARELLDWLEGIKK